MPSLRKGQGGRAPHFGLIKILFLDHYATTTQQTMMEKKKLRSNIVFLRCFLDSLRNCWQPTAVNKCDAIFRLINTPLRMCRVRDMSACRIVTRGGVEDTSLEAKAKAKDTKKIRGQGQGQGKPFRGQTLSRPRTGMLEAKAKDQGHKAQVLSKKKKKKVFTKIFQAISTKKRFPKNFSSAPQNFNIPKNCAVLEPRTGRFSRT